MQPKIARKKTMVLVQFVTSSLRVTAEVFDDQLETLSIENVGYSGRSPEVSFHLSSDVAMETPSVPDLASRQQRMIDLFFSRHRENATKFIL